MAKCSGYVDHLTSFAPVADDYVNMYSHFISFHILIKQGQWKTLGKEVTNIAMENMVKAAAGVSTKNSKAVDKYSIGLVLV